MVSKFALSGSQKLKISCLAGAAPQVGAAMRLKAGAARISVCHVFLFRFMGIALYGAYN